MSKTLSELVAEENLREENKRLKEENYRLRITYENTGTMMDRAALRAENRKLREVLQFYADQDNYLLPPADTHPAFYYEAPTVIRQDFGERARKALEDSK